MEYEVVTLNVDISAMKNKKWWNNDKHRIAFKVVITKNTQLQQFYSHLEEIEIKHYKLFTFKVDVLLWL